MFLLLVGCVGLGLWTDRVFSLSPGLAQRTPNNNNNNNNYNMYQWRLQNLVTLLCCHVLIKFYVSFSKLHYITNYFTTKLRMLSTTRTPPVPVPVPHSDISIEM